MSLNKFIKSLTHKLGKNEIAKSCEAILEPLRESTLPAIKAALEFTNENPLRSTEAKGFQTDIRRLVRGSGTDLFKTVLECMHNADTYLVKMRDESDTMFNEHEATIAMSYQKATFLRLISAIGFAVDYSRRLTNYIYLFETVKLDPTTDVKTQLPNAEKEFVEDNFSNFCIVLSALSKRYEQISTDIMGMPDALVTELTEATLPATLGTAKTDPFGFNNFVIPGDISARFNPFYLIGTLVASFQVAQYKTAKEQLELLQLRKLNLEKMYAKKPDAALQKQIENFSERVNDHLFEIAKMEKHYGI